MRIRLDREKNTINEINGIEQISLGNFSFFKQPIRVGTRKLHSSVTLEAQQDINYMRGIDVMKSMIDSLVDRIEITHFDRIIHYV